MDPLLSFWLFMMTMIVGGLAVSLWLAIRGGWRRPRPLMYYHCSICGYRVGLPIERDGNLKALISVGEMHQEMFHGAQ